MNPNTVRRAVIQVLLVLVGVAAVLTSGAPAQSLGDVAKQEEARRKGTAATGRGGKVYTNDDLRGAPAAAATSPQPSPSAPSSAAPAGASKPDAAKPDAAKPADGNAKAGDAQTPKADAKPADPKGDEATWRKRRQSIQEALDRAKTFAEALQSRINGLTADFSARDDPAQRSQVANDRQKALTELERVKKEIAQHTKALDDLQEEGRKSGVPAGWLR